MTANTNTTSADSVSNTQDVSVVQNVNDARNQVIKNVLLSIKEKQGSHQESVNDCLNALVQSKECLELHFTGWLWLPADFEYGTEEDKAYSMNLGWIEEALVMKGLIYND